MQILTKTCLGMTLGGIRHEQLALSVLRQFRLIFGSVRQHFRAVEATCGISGSQIWILQEINKSPGMGVSELAEKLSIHQSTCSQLVEKLVKSRFLKRVRLEKDRRCVGLTLTHKGLKTLERVPGPAEGVLPEALIALSNGGLKSLHANLDKLIAQLERADQRYADKPLADL